MRYSFLFVASLITCCFSLYAQNYPHKFEGNFEQWEQKRDDLISLFVPTNPVIIQAGSFSKVNHIDLMHLNLHEGEFQILKDSPRILDNVRCLSVHMGTEQCPELNDFLDQSGFQLFTHWYNEGIGGNAIFVKNDYFYNSDTCEYLKNNHIDDSYKRYFEPFFKVYYDLDSPGDTITRTLKQGYAYEGNIGIIIDDLTRPGSIAMDIGSHIGIHTVTMSRKVGPTGAVIAFEPKNKLYMELLHTLHINNCTNVISIAKGLGNSFKTESLVHIHIHQDDTPCENGETIDIIPLDSLNINNLSLIKMDIENYEYFALQGAKETILNNKPVIIFECWIDPDYENCKPTKKANFDRVISFIESCGYGIYVIYGNDFIAFPNDATGMLAEYKKKFKKLDFDNFYLGY